MKKIACLLLTVIIATSCSEDFLNQVPKGTINSETLDNPEAAEALVIAAYALVDQVYGSSRGSLNSNFLNPASNWILSDVRSGEAYKGGGGTGDLSDVNNIELGLIQPSNEAVQRKWTALYYAISRCNKAISALENLTLEEFAMRDVRIAEVRVLRGHFYFDLKKNFWVYPYIDEDELGKETEVINDLSSDQLWELIIEDFQAGVNGLPEVQSDAGRVDKYVAHAFLAKTYLFLKRYSDVVTQTDYVIGSGHYMLVANLQDLYGNPDYDYAGENIFAIQTSVSDGADRGGNTYYGDLLCTPPGPAYGGGDGFRRPSQNTVNTFKVDADGLPLLNSYNDSDLAADDIITPVDPRIDHAIGRPGIPWKDFTGEVYGDNWQRNPLVYGPYSTKKNIINPSSNLRASGGFPWAHGAYNYPLMKYSDVLLWKAEALIELNTNLDEARDLINMLRQRAMDSPVVMKLDGSGPAANYQIGLYPTSGWTQDYARRALRMERRLELGLEGHRFYDLVRWGIAASFINDYYATESLKRPYLAPGHFQEGKHEYLPIPQNEIDRSQGNYTQHPFYSGD